MMKKTIIIVAVTLFLTACTPPVSSWKAGIVYRPTHIKADHVEISVREGFILNQGHQYDVVETESGYDLVLHFVKDGDK